MDINDLQGRKAIALLRTYEGINPYIKDLKNKLIKDLKVKLTEGQAEYVTKFYDVPPQVLNKVVAINPLLGQSLQEKENLSFTPERILIQAILADQEKTYHIYGKVKKNQKHSKMYFLPKTMVLDDPYFTDCEIDVEWDDFIKLDVKGRKPYDHQKTGVEFLACRDGAILADDMGLGKTYQSIFSALVIGAKKVLVVCPASVKIAWQREIEAFGQKGIIVSGSHWPHVGKFTIINYDILKNFHTLGKFENPEEYSNFLQENYDLIILDEAHKIKNPKAQRTKLINDIVEKGNNPKVWLLTGTPIANRPMDFFNLLKLVKSPLGGNWKFYAQRYCEAKRFYKKLKNGRTKQIWVTDGASNLTELGVRTKNTLLRRLKTEALDMPDKTITTVYHQLSRTGWSQYESLWEDYLEKRAEDGKRKISLNRDLVELGLLRQFIAMQAIPKTVELTKNAIEQGQKVVIFTTFNDELNELSEEFGNECVIHNGSMTAKAKQNSIDKFQNNKKTKVFIGNITSAGVGITLTEGTVVIFNSFSWVPGDNEQAEDRCYRIGQKNNVSVYYQLFIGTVSLAMWYSLMKKQKNIDEILNKGDEHSERLRHLMNDLEENGLEL